MRPLQLILSLLLLWTCAQQGLAQELNAQVTINHKQIQGTDVSVFEDLKTKITEFLNTTHWTDQQYANLERIKCSFNITINKYSTSDNDFEGTLIVQSTRPVFNSSYTTTTFGITDGNFNFQYREFDQLTFRLDQVDNDLTALLAYYAYLLIGIDMDTMAPKGGEAVLQNALTVVTNAGSLTRSAKGWRAFVDHRNRHAIISDYLDGSMEPLRTLNYRYHREGLDVMAENADRGRAVITEALQLLKQAHENKTLSRLPAIFTDYKRDEIVNIYKKKASQTERATLVEMLKDLNASQSSYWNQIQ
ncbi:MAG: DUF4835 family protein [Alloprevotella sp.]|nr:DUF4835 family protein [Alloprevotella sp.]